MARTSPGSHDVEQALKGWMQSFAAASWRDTMRFVKSRGLSVPQFGVLLMLHHRERCGVSEIAGDMDITSPAASQLVERLVQQGLVERREDPRDRRARALSLSETGRRLVELGTAERYRWVERLAAVLTPSERSSVAAAIPVLEAAARKLGASENPRSRPDDARAKE